MSNIYEESDVEDKSQNITTIHSYGEYVGIIESSRCLQFSGLQDTALLIHRDNCPAVELGLYAGC